MISRDKQAATVYFNNENYAIATVAETSKLLRNLSSGSDVPRLARVLSVHGTMTIGLARPDDRSVALYLSSDGRPFHALDPSSTAAGENVCFELAGTNREFDSRCVVTLEQALGAVAEFIRAGELTKDLQWQAEGMGATA